jgi:hypothetical protein
VPKIFHLRKTNTITRNKLAIISKMNHLNKTNIMIQKQIYRFFRKSLTKLWNKYKHKKIIKLKKKKNKLGKLMINIKRGKNRRSKGKNLLRKMKNHLRRVNNHQKKVFKL